MSYRLIPSWQACQKRSTLLGDLIAPPPSTCNPLHHSHHPGHQTTSNDHGAYPYTFPSVLSSNYMPAAGNGCSDMGTVHPRRLPMVGGESVHVKSSHPYSVKNGFQGVPSLVSMWSEPQCCHSPAPSMAGSQNLHGDSHPH